MATTTTSISISSPDFLSILIPKTTSSLTHRATKKPLSFSSLTTISPKRTIIFHDPLYKNTTPIWRIHAAATEVPPLEATPLETSQEIVSAAGDGGASTAVSALLIVAFVGLSILTIGVIYIAVTDFLQKREREKFEKEEEKAEKKKGKKKKTKARAGPRGFGQKIEDDFDD